MGLIKVAGVGLEYVGKIAQADGFDEWVEGVGRGILDEFIEKQSFSIFKKKKAKKAIWEEIQQLVQSETLQVAIKQELDIYPRIIGSIAEKIEPNEHFAKGHVYVIPMFVLKDAAENGIMKRLGESNELSRLQGGGELKKYFLRQFIMDLDSAFREINFTSSNRVHSSDGWDVVGADMKFQWSDSKFGHYYLVQTKGANISNFRNIDDALNALKLYLGRISFDIVKEHTDLWSGWLIKLNAPPDLSTNSINKQSRRR